MPAHLNLSLPEVVRFGREICGDLVQAERRQWWLGNGLAGYAAGTVAGSLTRRYHGLLIAPVNPPLDRHLVSTLAEAVLLDGEREWELGTTHWTGRATRAAYGNAMAATTRDRYGAGCSATTRWRTAALTTMRPQRSGCSNRYRITCTMRAWARSARTSTAIRRHTPRGATEITAPHSPADHAKDDNTQTSGGTRHGNI